jgi:protein-tyrosine phosphatase
MGQNQTKNQKIENNNKAKPGYSNSNNNNYSEKEKSINKNTNNNNNGNTSNNNNNKSVNVSLSTTKCKYCNKNYIPNKVLRSHLFYCVDCYLKKKKLKYKADLDYHTEISFEEIIPNKLYLGNNEGAKNLEILKKNNITAILICGYFLSEFFPNQFIYKTLEIEDNEYEIITYSLVKGIIFIDDNKCIFVHCREGISRSSAIVISYIMFHFKKTYEEAYEFVLKKKKNIKPNNNFIKQMKDFEEMIKVCNYDIKMIKEFCINFTNNKYGKNLGKKNNEINE